MVRTGLGAFLGLGYVTSWSTTPTSSDIKKFFRPTTGFDGLQFERELIHFEDLNNVERQVTTTSPGMARVTGSVEVYPTYQDLPWLLRLFTEDQGTTAGTGPYTHTFDMLQEGDSNRWSNIDALCAEVYRGGGSNSTFYGALKCVGGSLSFQPGGFLTASVEFLGRSFSNSAKSSSPSWGDSPISLATGQATAFLKIGGGSYICRSATINFSKPHEERRDITDLYTEEPLQSDFRDLTLDVEIEVDDDSFLSDLQTLSGFKYASGAENELYVEKSSTEKLLVKFGCLYPQAPVEGRASGFGPTIASISFKIARNDESGATLAPSMEFVVTNNESTID